MVINEINNGLEIIGAEMFSLEDTFECGQCFRWEKIENKYHGVALNSEVLVYYKDGSLIIEGNLSQKSHEAWIKYFDLYLNYDNIRRNLADIDPVLKRACEFCPGIRILNQDPWETLCSFIISQNNNIPRIKGIISRLCESFGKKISENEFSFPEARIISELCEEDLKVIRCGFRAGYIIDAAKKVSSGEINLNNIEIMNIDDARKYLMQIRGVGPKVAECTLLYGFHKLEAFPIDVWMKRVMSEYFPDKNPKMFGKYAGLAQQYLFHYTRNNEK